MSIKQVDYDDPKRNMFGLLPCPRCGDEHRWPTQSVHPTTPNSIICDRCGYVELIEKGAE